MSVFADSIHLEDTPQQVSEAGKLLSGLSDKNVTASAYDMSASSKGSYQSKAFKKWSRMPATIPIVLGFTTMLLILVLYCAYKFGRTKR